MKMKRAGLFAAVLCAVSLIVAAPVSANSWGLKGALYRAVASTRTWDDYSVVGGQGENFALMGARYHNALFYAEDNAHLQVYHTAVWQPEDHVRQSIQQTDDGLILSAGSERYTFRREEGALRARRGEAGRRNGFYGAERGLRRLGRLLVF